MQRVPVIDHDGFVLTESIAIMKYLSRENFIPDALYPKDSKLQARVEEFLEWHHVGLRLHCAMYFRVAYMNPILTGSKLDDKTIENYKRRMLTALEDLDTKWLGRGTEYIAGDTITVADLVAACELEQPRMASFEPAREYANIAAWWPKVRHHFSPHYEEAHNILNKIIKKVGQASAKL
ncbi:hypothetical protein O3G_MSEX003456 [Manduca sexta]|nr:hypothetical protein O3G_MSEX003456 [Manduca sexta]